MNINTLIHKPVIRVTLILGLVILLLLNFLFARLSITQQRWAMDTYQNKERYLLPSAKILAAGFLNYRSIASDLVWIKMLVYFGARSTYRQPVDHLPEYARTASELDPYFYDLYRWYPDVWIQAKFPVSEERIEQTNQFLERGMKFFPLDARLAETAASNYIGYSADAPAERRARESGQAIEYLLRAASLQNASSNVPFLLDYFYDRKHRLESELRGEEVVGAEGARSDLTQVQKDTYLRLYMLAPDEQTRARLEMVLQSHGIDKQEAFQQVRQYAGQFDAAYYHDLNYMPTSLWSTMIDAR